MSHETNTENTTENTPETQQVTRCGASQATQETRETQETQETITPRANLYATADGWALVSALPEAQRDAVELKTEGSTLSLSAPRAEGGRYQRSFEFPSDTRWGDLSARWEGDLLHVNLERARPERREISIVAS